LPWEHLDPLSGSVILTLDPVVLSGHAGFTLTIPNCLDLSENDGDGSGGCGGWAPSVMDPGGITFFPRVTMPDGTILPTFRTADPHVFITSTLNRTRFVGEPIR
jgi:hypothetical protein